jgi:hypothetical protein
MLVDADLDAGVELDAAEVAHVDLIGGTNLSRDNRMERYCDGRRESGWGHATRAGARER